jgi:predicted enzyme related to lactoylglutathione lyase
MDERYSIHSLFSWNELSTSDAEGAKKFYGQLFGWVFDDMPLKDTSYSVIQTGGYDLGGIMNTPPNSSALPRWLPYITVDEVKDTVRQAERLGAQVLPHPTEIPDVGRFAVLRDPQGADFAVITYLKPE